MTDEPIAYTASGRPLFDNTPTVVCVAVPVGEGLLAIRRAHNPGAGKLCLPGGYHMRGEPWQVGGFREVMEESGFEIDPQKITQRHLVTDEYLNNVVFGMYEGQARKTDAVLDGEALEVVVITEAEMNPGDWAFPLHFAFANRALNEIKHDIALRPWLDAQTSDGLGNDARFLALGLIEKLKSLTPDWREIVQECQYEMPQKGPGQIAEWCAECDCENGGKECNWISQP